MGTILTFDDLWCLGATETGWKNDQVLWSRHKIRFPETELFLGQRNFITESVCIENYELVNQAFGLLSGFDACSCVVLI